MAIFNKDAKGIDDIKNSPTNSNALSIIAAGTKILGDIDTDGVTALFVPGAVLTIWWIVRSIRRRHISGDRVD